MIATRKAPIDQIGFVTADLDSAVAQWTDALSVGPWMVFRDVTLNGEYRGEPVSVLIDVALGYRGSEQIEFIQPRSTWPSPYQDKDGAPLEGIHHLAWIVDDLAVDVIYLEDPAQPGTLFELISGPESRAMHSAGLAAARDWDGSNAITELSLAEQ